MPPGIGQNDRHQGRAAWIQTLIMATMMAPTLRNDTSDHKKRAKTVFKRNKLPVLKEEEGRNDPSPQAIQNTSWVTKVSVPINNIIVMVQGRPTNR
jgi:hypothetical protein